MTSLTTAELDQLYAMRTQARLDAAAGVKSYYLIYQALADWLTMACPPSSRTKVKEVKSAHQENGGQENDQQLVQRQRLSRRAVQDGGRQDAARQAGAEPCVGNGLLRATCGRTDHAAAGLPGCAGFADCFELELKRRRKRERWLVWRAK